MTRKKSMTSKLSASEESEFSVIHGLGWLLVILSALGIAAGGFLSWTAVFCVFFIFPFFESFWPEWALRPPNSSHGWNSFLSCNLWVWPSPIILSCFLIWSSKKFTATNLFFEKIGILASSGFIMGAIGITAAHELVHRRNIIARALGVWNLALVNFAHWGIEHVFGHHRNVGTPEDPASAKKGQSLYIFWIQNYRKGLVNSFRHEKNRLKDQPLSIIKNRIIHYSLVSGSLSGIIFVVNSQILIFWWGQSIIAILLLLSVDYIEHYGLRRKKRHDSSYEPVSFQHSWDSQSWITNALLLNLGLHSHHHMKASLPFSNLKSQAKAPLLPYGYSVMILLALIPPIFFKLMNPRISNDD
jgi:alkane 1-monooxygenase